MLRAISVPAVCMCVQVRMNATFRGMREAHGGLWWVLRWASGERQHALPGAPTCSHPAVTVGASITSREGKGATGVNVRKACASSEGEKQSKVKRCDGGGELGALTIGHVQCHQSIGNNGALSG